MQNSTVYLAIDYGEKRIGLAVGAVIPRCAGVLNGELAVSEIISAFKKIISENEVAGLVIGMPYKNDNEEGTIVPLIRNFSEILCKETGLPVFYEREDFTSEEAKEYLREMGEEYERKEGRLDEVAACIILENFLSRLEIEGDLRPDIGVL